jgi:hypothetical protein
MDALVSEPCASVQESKLDQETESDDRPACALDERA